MPRSISVVALGVALATLSVVPAAADEFPPPDKVCTGSGGAYVVDRAKLAAWFVNGKVSPKAVDLNGDEGETAREKMVSLARPALCLDRKGCAAKDQASLVAGNGVISDMIAGRSDKYRLIPRGTEPRNVVAYLENGQHDISCIASGQDGGTIEKERKESAGFVDWLRIRGQVKDLVVDWLRIRGQVKDLAVDRSNQGKFDAVKYADFSLTDNMKSNRQTFDINVVTGLSVASVEVLGGATDLMPYVHYERRFMDKNETGKPLNNKLSFGLLAAGYGSFGNFFWEYSLYPQYITDDKFRTEIGSITGQWTPNLDLPAYGAFCCGGWINARWIVEARGSAGHVFDNGGNETLKDSKEYARAGARAELLLRGGEDTMLRNIQLDVSYSHLFGFVNPNKSLPRFESVLAYLFPDTKYFSLQFKYVNGYTDDTLVKEEFFKASFGVRY